MLYNGDVRHASYAEVRYLVRYLLVYLSAVCFQFTNTTIQRTNEEVNVSFFRILIQQ